MVEGPEGPRAGHGSETLSGWVVDSCHSPGPLVSHVAGPHRRSAAGTPRCSPAAPARTAALASSLSETWAPGLRTPGGWGCWANLQPSGNLETGGHSQPGSGSLGRSPSSAPDLPQRSHLHDGRPGGSLTRQQPVQATQHLPPVLRVGVGPACAKRREPPPSAGLARPAPAGTPGKARRLGISADEDGVEGMQGHGQ